MADRGDGVTLRDVAALVVGAAAASAHLRGAYPEALSDAGWAFVWATFAGIALTAAGPFLYLARRHWRRPPGHPRTGDGLWAILGLPWVLTAPIRTALPTPHGEPSGVFALALILGLGVSCLTSFAIVWSRWILVPPGSVPERGPSPWTDRVGLALAVAWPVQCGLALAVLG